MPATRTPAVGLVTCANLPRPDVGLPFLKAAFERLGVRGEIVAWDDPSVDWGAFDAAVLQSTWNYVQRYDAFVAWLGATAARLRLLNPLPLVRWNLHKRYLLELAAAGIVVVPTELVPAGGTIDWEAAFRRWGPLVVKPAISAGSFATIRVDRDDVASAEAHRVTHASRDMLVQPLLGPVLVEGERNLVFLGGEFSHAIRKGARWSGDAEASGGMIDPTPEELSLAQSILAYVHAKGIGRTCYARVDLARDERGAAVLMELELIEPSLFLDRVPGAADRLARAVLGTISG